MDGTDAQKEYRLPKPLRRGHRLFCPPSRMPDGCRGVRTRADADGDGFVINGSKRYITNAPRANLFTVFARTSQKAWRAGQRVRPADTPGSASARRTRRWVSRARTCAM